MEHSNHRIRELRLYLGLSMAEFARYVGYSPTHIARLEQGTSEPREVFIEKLCELFGVDMEYFTGNMGNMTLEDAVHWSGSDVEDGAENSVEKVYDGRAPERLKALRSELGLSQRAFANKVGVNNSLISEVEAGNRELSITAAKKIEAAFNIGYEWLLYGTEEKKNYPVSSKLVNWLWSDENVRKELWERMEPDGAG